ARRRRLLPRGRRRRAAVAERGWGVLLPEGRALQRVRGPARGLPHVSVRAHARRPRRARRRLPVAPRVRAARGRAAAAPPDHGHGGARGGSPLNFCDGNTDDTNATDRPYGPFRPCRPCSRDGAAAPTFLYSARRWGG